MKQQILSVPAALLLSGMSLLGGGYGFAQTGTAFAAGCTLSPTGADQSMELQLAVNSCAIVQLTAGTFFVHDVGINQPVTVSGVSPFFTTLDARRMGRIFHIPLNPGGTGLGTMGGAPFIVTLKNIRFQNGSTRFAPKGPIGGGAIENEGTMTLNLNNDDFRNNTTIAFGGAVHSTNESFLFAAVGSQVPQTNVTASTFEYNSANEGGALDGDIGVLNVTGSSFRNTQLTGGTGRGGAIATDDFEQALNVSNSNFTQNGDLTSPALGTPTYNGASSRGGAISTTARTTTVSNSTFFGNMAGNSGGAIQHTTGSMTVNNSNFTSNSAPGQFVSLGGAINDFNSSGLQINGSRFQTSSASSGGGVALFFSGRGMASITPTNSIANTFFNANHATGTTGGGVFGSRSGGSGGGLDLFVAGVTLTNVNFSNNTAANGGGLY